jgi:hypothetical protein
MSQEIGFVRRDGSLVPMDQVKSQLTRLTSPTDVSDLARRAAAAKRACDQTDERRDYFAELSIWATVRLGELLKAMPKRTNQNGAGNSMLPTLSECGIEKMQASRSQKLASAKTAIDSYIADCKSRGKEFTKAGALAAVKRQLRAESLARKSKMDLPPGFSVTASQTVIKCDSIITDPPYGITREDWEPKDIETFTRDWLSRWNNCGAVWFISFFSQAGVWDMRRWMDIELTNYRFYHLAMWHYPNAMGVKVDQVLKESWEPIFIYCRKDLVSIVEEWDWSEFNNLDCIREGAPRPGFEGDSEQRHPCQKPVRVMKFLVTAFCKKEGLIVDPFCGSGTTGIAARQTGRRFHGIEINAAYRQLAKSRILSFGEME